MVDIKYMTALLVGDHSLSGPKNDHPTPPKKALRSRPSVLNIGSCGFTPPWSHLPRARASMGGTLTESSLKSLRLCLRSLGRKCMPTAYPGGADYSEDGKTLCPLSGERRKREDGITLREPPVDKGRNHCLFIRGITWRG